MARQFGGGFRDHRLIDYGVALEDPKHTYRISNTLTGRYARLDQQARKICMQNLFGAGGE